MRSQPPFVPPSNPEAVDLLVVGALSIDRFANGSTAAGGSVVHATRAAAVLGARVAVVTVAGPEPAAGEFLDELSLLAVVHAGRAPATLSYSIETVAGARRLTLAAASPVLAAPTRPLRPRAVLYGPVAGEFGAGLGGQQYAGAVRVGILQGWLRRLEPGRSVEALPLSSIPAALVDALSGFDALIASAEDLAAEPGSPEQLVERLGDTFGRHPLPVVTDGARGAWFRDGEATGRVAPSSVLPGSAVGAGDAFAAALSLALADGVGGHAAVRQATEGTIAALDAGQR